MKKTLTIPAVIIAILLVIILLAEILAGTIVKSALKDAVSEGNELPYQLEFDQFNASLIGGSISGTSMKLSPASGAMQDKRKDHVILQAESFSISGINLWDYLFNNELSIDDVEFDTPEISYLDLPQHQPDQKDTASFDLHKLIEKHVKGLYVEKIQINNGQFKWTKEAGNERDSTVVPLTVKSLTLHLEALKVNAEVSEKTNGLPLADQFSFRASGVDYRMSHKYHLITDSLSVSSADSLISIIGVHLQPQYPNKEFTNLSKYESERMEIKAPEINFNGFNLNELISNKRFTTKLLSVKNTAITVFRDKTKPFDHSQQKQLPQLMLQELPITIQIDSANLEDWEVNYRELYTHASQAGHVYFKRLNAQISNISNDSSHLEKEPKTIAFADAYLMGSGYTQARLVFFPARKDGHHTFSGNISDFDLRKLNPAVKYMEFIEIQSGHIRELRFDGSADTVNAHGNVEFYYNDLNIKLLEKTEGLNLKRELKGFFMNIWAVQKNNLPQDNITQHGSIEREYDNTRSVFNYWLKSIFSGIDDIVVRTKS